MNRRRYPRKRPFRFTAADIRSFRRQIAAMQPDEFKSAANFMGLRWFNLGRTPQQRRQYRRDAGRAFLRLVISGELRGLVIIEGTRSPVYYRRDFEIEVEIEVEVEVDLAA